MTTMQARPAPTRARPPVAGLWAVILAAPSLVLVDLTGGHALVTPLCQHQAGGWLHAWAALFVVAALAMAAGAGAAMRRLGGSRGPEEAAAADPSAARALLLARLATGVAGLSALVMVAMWIPVAFLSPCV